MNTAKPDSRLFSRDFTIMVIGQIASLFGNSILRFSLSLYVLDVTGSAAAFGGILAASMIPTVLFSPIGGVLADRVSRKWIMVVLDFTTAGFLAGFLLLLPSAGVTAVAVFMILLTLIQAFYQPSVQSSIPVLVPQDRLEQGNGIAIQVNALAQLLGPIFGGMLYGFFGLSPILISAFFCFAFSAVMELFLHIPFVRLQKNGGALKTVADDLKGALRFMIRDNPDMGKLLLLIAALNMFMSAMMIVGLPYLVKIFLGLSSQMYGFVESSMAVGSILGGLLAGFVVKKLALSKTSGLLFAAALCTAFLAVTVITNQFPYVSYGAILLCVLTAMCFSTLFSIIAQSFAQKITPNMMLGKVMSLVMTICTCAMPLGQALYGGLFSIAGNRVYLVVLFAGAASLVIAYFARRVLQRLQNMEAKPSEPEAQPPAAEGVMGS